jgi:hypothetical protein
VGEETPEEVVDGFGAALRAGAVGTATALFTRESYLVTDRDPSAALKLSACLDRTMRLY